MSPATPKRFGPWEVIHKVDKGGFASAFLAKHEQTRRKVIIKQLDPMEANRLGAKDLDYFIREATILSKLDSKYISRLFDYDFKATKPWIAVQYFPGTNLWDYIEQGSVVNEVQWFQTAHDILSGLEHAHSKGIVHRDLNPKNIILFYEGARLIDFGLSRFTDDPNSTRAIGFDGFIAPELGHGNPTPAYDIFVAATALSAAGTGQMPWRVQGGSWNSSIFKDTPNYKGLSQNQITLLSRMHSKNPQERITATEGLRLIEELAPTTAGVQIPQQKRVQPVIPAAPLRNAEAIVADRLKNKADALNAKFNVVGSANKSLGEWAKERKELMILGFLTGGWAWIIYAIASIMPKVGKLSYKPRGLYAMNLALAVVPIGFFSSFVTTYWYRKLKTRRLLQLMCVQYPLFIALIIGFATTPKGGTAADWVAIVWILLLISAPFIGSDLYKYFAKDDPSLKQEPNQKKSAVVATTEDVAEEEGSSNPDYTKAHASWDEVEAAFAEALSKVGKKRFVIGVESNHIKGIFLQGYSEPDGSKTVEAAADLSVRPKITIEQRANLNSLGWDSPDDGLPNFIQFLTPESSSPEFMAQLFTATLKDGYGLNIGTFKVVR